MLIGGLIVPIMCGLFLDTVPCVVFLVVSGVGWILAPLLLAVSPAESDFWAFVLPALLCYSLGVDINFLVSSVSITSYYESENQGDAGALINSIIIYGAAIFLAIGASIDGEMDLKASQTPDYRPVFWMEMGVAAFGLLVILALAWEERKKLHNTH